MFSRESVTYGASAAIAVAVVFYSGYWCGNRYCQPRSPIKAPPTNNEDE